MRIETLFQFNNIESKATATRDRIASLEVLQALTFSPSHAAEVERLLTAEKARLAGFEASLQAVGTKERLALVEQALEACGTSEASGEEEAALKAEAAILRCELLREEGKAPAPISTFDLARAGEVFDLRLT